MAIQVLQNLKHLWKKKPIALWPLVKRIATLYPDYYWTRGFSRYLLNITLELTYACNADCAFCFLQEGILNSSPQQLEVEDIQKLVKETKKHKVGYYLTGGEPFLHRDIMKIVSIIKGAGLHCGINTNGMKIKREEVDRLCELGLDYLIVSLHGPPDLHNELLRRPNAFSKAFETLRRFLEHSSRPSLFINTVLTLNNLERLPEMFEHLKGLPVDGLTVQHERFTLRSEWLKHTPVWTKHFRTASSRVPHEEKDGRTDMAGGKENGGEIDILVKEPLYQESPYPLDQVKDTVARLKEAAEKNEIPLMFKPDIEGESIENWYGNKFSSKNRCYYLHTDTRVAPNGDVTACQFMPHVMGNIRSDSIWDIYNEDDYRRFRVALKSEGGLLPGCSRCCKMYRDVKV